MIDARGEFYAYNSPSHLLKACFYIYLSECHIRSMAKEYATDLNPWPISKLTKKFEIRRGINEMKFDTGQPPQNQALQFARTPLGCNETTLKFSRYHDTHTPIFNMYEMVIERHRISICKQNRLSTAQMKVIVGLHDRVIPVSPYASKQQILGSGASIKFMFE